MSKEVRCSIIPRGNGEIALDYSEKAASDNNATMLPEELVKQYNNAACYMNFVQKKIAEHMQSKEDLSIPKPSYPEF